MPWLPVAVDQPVPRQMMLTTSQPVGESEREQRGHEEGEEDGWDGGRHWHGGRSACGAACSGSEVWCTEWTGFGRGINRRGEAARRGEKIERCAGTVA